MQERFYFGDTVLPLFESGIPLVRERLQSLPDADNITIAYPDEGAWKRFHYQFGDYPEVSPCSASPHKYLRALLLTHLSDIHLLLNIAVWLIWRLAVTQDGTCQTWRHALL